MKDKVIKFMKGPGKYIVIAVVSSAATVGAFNYGQKVGFRQLQAGLFRLYDVNPDLESAVAETIRTIEADM